MLQVREPVHIKEVLETLKECCVNHKAVKIELFKLIKEGTYQTFDNTHSIGVPFVVFAEF